MLNEYFAMVRGVVAGNLDPVGASPAARLYGELVAAQQRQVLRTLFAPVIARIGPVRFEETFRSLRLESPPRDPNPSRWAGAFVAVLARAAGVDKHSLALAEFLALRVALSQDADIPWIGRAHPHARVVLFFADPRVALSTPARYDATSPTLLAFVRDDQGTVRSYPVSGAALAAWGLALGESGAPELTRAMAPAQLRAGERELLVLGMIR
ncbi:MAG: hypothetical protein RL385_2968 [Pseudomonadota bacterium]|jgi:hypothetical protein